LELIDDANDRDHEAAGETLKRADVTSVSQIHLMDIVTAMATNRNSGSFKVNKMMSSITVFKISVVHIQKNLASSHRHSRCKKPFGLDFLR